MKHVMVFATSVESPLGVSAVASGLHQLTGVGRWNFDLDDCDRILRVEADCGPGEVIALLESAGFQCAELSDIVPANEWELDNRMAS